MTFSICPVRPDSRGTILSKRADHTIIPNMQPNYITCRNEGRVLMAGMRAAIAAGTFEAFRKAFHARQQPAAEQSSE